MLIWPGFEWRVALRFLREGRMQTLLILAGTTGGVAVIVFLTQLITQLQAQIVDRVLGSQAHVVIRPLEEANRRAIDADGYATVIEPRAQRLRNLRGAFAVEPSRAAALRGQRIFDHPQRSLRGRVITQAYFFDLGQEPLPEVRGGDDAAYAEWLPQQQLGAMQDQFHDDHWHILDQFLDLSPAIHGGPQA